jgi:hypothetical protein
VKLSDDRISHLAHKVFNRIYDDDVVDFVDEDRALRVVKRSIEEFREYYEEVDRGVRYKITSMKRKVHEGSYEWEILYRKYLEEELNKLKKT